jgi:ferritin
MTVARSSPPNTSLQSLLHEIEATPIEYWSDLLETLRQFRQKIPHTIAPVINVQQAEKNQPAIDLLDSWLDDSEDANEHQQAWDFLKTALDEDRLSDRPLFP